MSNLRTFLPRAQDYAQSRRNWRADLLAGVTVGIVALPLALAFGVSSGVGAEAGLITAVVAGFIAAVFGGSNVQVSGPTGAMVVVLAPVVAVYGPSAVVVVGLIAGFIVVAMGLLKLGRAVSFIPWPVIEGFTLGIAVIIFLQQVPAAVGSPDIKESTSALVNGYLSVVAANPAAVAWSAGSVILVAAIMVLLPKFVKLIPGSIIAIVVVTVLAEVLAAPLARIGVLPSSLKAPSWPDFSSINLGAMIAPAIAVAALAAIESLLSARVASTMGDNGTFDPDRELFGQGLASIGSALFGGMPATGAIARTAVNIRSGGKTRMAAIVHAAVLLGVVYLATGPVSRIPLAALSGVLMVTAARMIPWRAMFSIIKSTKSDAVIFVATAIITVGFDLIEAVIIGIVATAFFALRALVKSSGVHRESIPGEAQPGDERIAVFRMQGALFFGASDRILDSVTHVSGVSVVIIRMSELQFLDATGARVLVDIVDQLERQGITALIKGVQPGHIDLVRRVGVLGKLRHENHLFDNLDAAVAHARSHIVREASA
ncbi:SulP family inorganic anion transporter [Alpinimonas psychrophila]|uniref:SulP family sulfate permease n=1 Tax=Alpinimonas psychrophila TaxID=748908 RepID=A0A7W3JV65_9MICO|nr:SulP family inorganic anion transporter [Alpinimonas psychrophila]MBA8829823.1 SulP family sulfate permease [Alpinimonas psychrophila]